jgi:hypothetical protein
MAVLKHHIKSWEKISKPIENGWNFSACSPFLKQMKKAYISGLQQAVSVPSGIREDILGGKLKYLTGYVKLKKM